ATLAAAESAQRGPAADTLEATEPAHRWPAAAAMEAARPAHRRAPAAALGPARFSLAAPAAAVGITDAPTAMGPKARHLLNRPTAGRTHPDYERTVGADSVIAEQRATVTASSSSGRS